jgi:signal transduction histidine kinase
VIQRYETRRIRKDGTHIDVSVTLSPVRNASGQIIGGSAIGHDITQRKQIEAEQKLLYEQVRHGEKQLHHLANHLQATREDERSLKISATACA